MESADTGRGRAYAGSVSTPTGLPWGHGLVMRGRVRALRARDPQDPTAAPAPVERTVALRRSGLGGPVTATVDDHAVFVYPWEHYPYWADVLGGALPEFEFGEDVSTLGLVESEVHLGDTFAWGSAVVQVSAPGAARPGSSTGPVALPDPGGRNGFHLRVLSPGNVSATDELILLDVDPVAIRVDDAARIIAEGPVAAGFTVERVDLARHLFPADWVAQALPPARDPADAQQVSPAAG
jgi:hypothetical protein